LAKAIYADLNGVEFGMRIETGEQPRSTHHLAESHDIVSKELHVIFSIPYFHTHNTLAGTIYLWTLENTEKHQPC
jgi:hypothetical protein